MSQKPPESASFSWRAIAWLNFAVAVVLGICLLVVTASKDGSYMAVVALFLATIAFLIQIAAYVVQSNDARRQREYSQQIYSDTMEALGKIDTKADQLNQSLGSVTTSLLQTAVEKTGARVAVAEGESIEEILARIERFLEDESTTQVIENARNVRSSASGIGHPSADQIQPPMNAERRRELHGVLESLSRDERDGLEALGRDFDLWAATLGAGIPFVRGSSGLSSRGLIMQGESPTEDEQLVWVLTAEGRDLVGLMREG